MRFSIFTPTHDTTHLLETYRSILSQTTPDWEWVIALNNGAVMPAEINDPRVRVIEVPSFEAQFGIGALKRFACEYTKGEYLVELDHDDLLLPHALMRVEKAIKQEQPGFIYSDAAIVRADGTFLLFGKENGWEHYEQKPYQVNRSFEPDASSLRRIFFAPDHVRVWERGAYFAVGGHDPRLAVCDDYDLVIRTYLHGVKFHHIKECLYVYRVRADGKNTWLKHNALIQTKQEEIGNRAQGQLVHEWCRRSFLPEYDLGCGTSPAEGYAGVDLPGSGARIECDIMKGLPFEDDSAGSIRAYDFLEHVPHCRDSRCTHERGCVVFVMNEIYRVLAPGGWLLSATPSTDGRGAFQDPTHCSFWNTNSFWYYTRQQQRAFVPGIKVRFQAARVATEFPSDWHKQHDIPYVYAELVALKGQRQPGICEV